MEQIKFTATLDLQKIDDQLVTALEGGSNYWYFLPNKDIEEPLDFNRKSEIHYEFLDKVYQGATLVVEDLEDHTKLGELNMATIKRGLEIMAEKYKHHFSDMMAETGDAITADVFFQLCIMGKIIYG
jgi:hypothetical protein